MRKLLLIAILFTAGCAVRSETMRYTRDTLPQWILDEWGKAQDEISRLEPPVPSDPHRVSPYAYEWIQLDRQFHRGDRMLKGYTNFDTNTIIICCGSRETVRHEAWHAILEAVGDYRFPQHYPNLKRFVRR